MKKWLPNKDRFTSQGSLRFLQPFLKRSYLWRWSRKKVALGVAIGIYFGFQIPFFQIIAAAFFAIVLRAHLPSAAAFTMITNPITFVPILYSGYRLGRFVLGESNVIDDNSELPNAVISHSIFHSEFWQQIPQIATPLFVGLTILAVIGSIIAYWTVNGIWLAVILRRKRKRALRVQQNKQVG